MIAFHRKLNVYPFMGHFIFVSDLAVWFCQILVSVGSFVFVTLAVLFNDQGSVTPADRGLRWHFRNRFLVH